MNSYIVVVSPAYGGAEKRFFDVFTGLVRLGFPVKLIAPSSLVNQLKQDHQDRTDVLNSLMPIAIDGQWSRVEFIFGLRRLLKTLPRRASFHYPLNCLWPLHLLRGDRVTMSVADCTSVPSLFSSKQNSVWTWLSFYFVQRIDILSPAVHEALQGHSRKKIMSLTPGGTYLVPPGLHKGVRKPTVCFLGRLVEQKGLEDLFDVLPSTWALLQLEVPPNFSFVIAGYGSLESYVKMKVLELARSHIPISFIGYADANELLAESTILLSLQEVTNYPSRVVAESLMAGCAVIVRDTGDSRKFGDDFPGLIYCEAKLDAKELAEQILNFLNRSAREFDFSASLRNTALIRFSSPSYIDYYRAILTGKSPTSDSLN